MKNRRHVATAASAPRKTNSLQVTKTSVQPLTISQGPAVGRMSDSSRIHTLPLIYGLLSQTMSNNNHEILDKRVEDCRQELLECLSWLPDSRRLLLNDFSNALYYRFREPGGI